MQHIHTSTELNDNVTLNVYLHIDKKGEEIKLKTFVDWRNEDKRGTERERERASEQERERER